MSLLELALGDLYVNNLVGEAKPSKFAWDSAESGIHAQQANRTWPIEHGEWGKEAEQTGVLPRQQVRSRQRAHDMLRNTRKIDAKEP